MRAAATDAGHESQLPIDLSHEADIAGSDGDLYDLHGDVDIPPAYAQHDYNVVNQSERSALALTDRTSVGRIIVAAPRMVLEEGAAVLVTDRGRKGIG